MNKVTIKNFIQDFIFLTAAQTLSSQVDMALHFPQRHQSRFLFHSFSAFFVCIVEELTSLSVLSLSLTVDSKSYGFVKIRKLLSESEELQEVSLDDKLESLIVCS